ncbi:hypothetical protein TrVFT333_004810 [Trichoderma virens FT-333]|nr:hypothetical protein TrVFT333_004810 [Trichoderma virens FT-333]
MYFSNVSAVVLAALVGSAIANPIPVKAPIPQAVDTADIFARGAPTPQGVDTAEIFARNAPTPKGVDTAEIFARNAPTPKGVDTAEIFARSAPAPRVLTWPRSLLALPLLLKELMWQRFSLKAIIEVAGAFRRS